MVEELESSPCVSGMALAEQLKALRTPCQNELSTLLVTSARGFYNPPNTALETVVTFVHMPGNQRASRMVETSASECLNIHSIFSISQEH